jgi:hypothetical protein
MGDEKFFLASRKFFQTYTGKPTETRTGLIYASAGS